MSANFAENQSTEDSNIGTNIEVALEMAIESNKWQLNQRIEGDEEDEKTKRDDKYEETEENEKDEKTEDAREPEIESSESEGFDRIENENLTQMILEAIDNYYEFLSMLAYQWLQLSRFLWTHI